MGNTSKIGILVGGGPAPGINSVISAATIRGELGGVQVVGLLDGFENLIAGRVDCVRPLTIGNTSRKHFRGGSMLGTSRANPTKVEGDLERVLASLGELNVDKLITIGGDDTAFSAHKLQQVGAGRVRVVHVPKTIDNDLDLPRTIDTFGFQTARHVGVEVVKNLMTDAKTTSRWYFAISMGRKAGHLALGMGKAAGATLTLIPEEWYQRPHGYVPLKWIVDTLVGAVIKRLAEGRRDGVAILAEGLVEHLDPKELEHLDTVERDEHGHIRIAEVEIGALLKREVRNELTRLGIKQTIVEKNIGYELRCADPIPYDMDYCRDLGYCAAKYLLEGGNAAMVSVQGGHFVPVPFHDLIDPVTGRTRVRMVDIRSTSYAIARRYMIRLRRDDFADDGVVASFAKIANITPAAFRERFEYLVDHELPPLVLR